MNDDANRPRTIERYLSQCGAASREEAKRAVADGRVRVNGTVTSQPDRWIDPTRDRVELDGSRVHPRVSQRLVVFNKPKGVLVTANDPEGRATIYDVLPKPFDDRSLRAIGRLDRASAGLLLLTDDTQLSDALLGGDSHVTKEYRVKVAPAPDESQLNELRRGIDIGDTTPTRPAEIILERTNPKSAVLRFVLVEGRNRQIRRMVDAVGGRVDWLVRVRFGPIELGDLIPGAARAATDEEWASVQDQLDR